MAVAVCETEGCENAGISIDVETTFTDVDGNTQTVDAVMCGVCGQPITAVD